jgi:hypothetical protein
MAWSTLAFGKHKGKTLPQIVFTDPDWFFWAIEENVFKGPLRREAERIDARARAIRIPMSFAQRVTDYSIRHQPVARLTSVQLSTQGQLPFMKGPNAD